MKQKIKNWLNKIDYIFDYTIEEQNWGWMVEVEFNNDIEIWEIEKSPNLDIERELKRHLNSN